MPSKLLTGIKLSCSEKVIDKDELIRKVHNRTEALQKEIKEIYAILKSLIEKGLPYFWDTENRLLTK